MPDTSSFSAIALVLALLPASCEAPTQFELVIRDVQIIDVESGEANRRSIGIQDGTIMAISDTRISGKIEKDGFALWAIPGLWDMHVHISDPVFFDLMVVNGVVGARDMGGDLEVPGDGCSAVEIEQLQAWRGEIEKGERIGPRLQLAGPAITGRHGSVSLPATTEAEARDAVAEIDARGADFVKVYEDLTPAVFRAIVDEAQARNLPVAGHVSEETLTITEAIEADQRSIEHVRAHLAVCFAETEDELDAFYAADGWTEDDRLWGARHRAQCPSVWRGFRENDVWLTPTLAVDRSWIVGDTEDFVNDPRRQRLPSTVREGVLEFSAHLRDRSEQEIAEADAWWNTVLKFVARANREGVHFLAGSDAACEGVIPGFGLHDQLSLFVDAGLTPLQAIQAATIESAAYFERSDVSGRILPGYDADILLLDADPRADIGAVSQINSVVLRGRLLERTELDQLLTGDADPPARPRQD